MCASASRLNERILFRTDQPFPKVAVSLTAPAGSQHKIEFLCDGQQVAVAGIHPDTQRSYAWFGGEPWAIARDDLPSIARDEACSLMEHAADLLVREFGFARNAASNGKAADGPGDTGERADWDALIGNVLDGTEVHDSLRNLAASCIAKGYKDTDTTALLRSLMRKTRLDRDDHWLNRYNDIPRHVRTARERFAADWISSPGIQPEQGADNGAEGDKQCRPKLVQSSADFVAGFIPPDYVVDGILQRRFIYSFTGQTGGGKTAAALLIAAYVALGRAIGKIEVTQGRVLYAAGENPDDIRMRWIAMSQRLDFDIGTISVSFVPWRGSVDELRGRLRAELSDEDVFSLVVVDTSAAFFGGADENDNVQALQHALKLRALSTLPGGPTVLVACHPVKNAGPDNLLPRGGGAFLNEMDGNLTARKTNSLSEIHWQGKFRGPEFAPITLLLRTVTHERLKDSKGRLISTVVAEYVTDVAQAEMEAAARRDEDAVLALVQAHGKGPLAGFAVALGWYLKSGEANRMKVKRALDSLKAEKLVVQERGGWVLTEKGEKALKK